MAEAASESATNSNTDNSSFSVKSSICSVEYHSHIGAGAFYRLQFPETEGNWRTLFITSNRVVPISNKSQVTGLKLIFESSSIRNLYITPDWVEHLWSSPYDDLDVTVIELSAIAIKILSQEKIVRLCFETPGENESIFVFLHYGGEIVHGNIDNINEKIIRYNFYLETEVTSGSPIFNVHLKVVGIESGFLYPRNKRKHIGHIIKVIFDSFKTELIKQFGAKSENEMWLSKITEIQTNTDNCKFIGGGAYGKVYMTKESNGNFLALKMVEGFAGPNGFERQARALQQEYAIVTSLDIHPRIIQFFALVKDDQHARLYIVMEYLEKLEGGSLLERIKQCLKQNVCLDKKCTLKYMVQILEGVEYLHQNKIYHSDIKPENILLNSDDNIKICDFGIALQMKIESSATTSHINGSCHYMSPERIEGAGRSAENDIWSIGATFVTMISGHTINHNDKGLLPQIKIAQYKIFVEGKPLDEYLQSGAVLSRSSSKRSSGLRSDKLHNCAESTNVYQFCSSVLRSSLRNAHKQVTNYMSINIIHNIHS